MSNDLRYKKILEKMEQMKFLIKQMHILNPGLSSLLQADDRTALSLLRWGRSNQMNFDILNKLYYNTLVNLGNLREALGIKTKKTVTMTVDLNNDEVHFYEVVDKRKSKDPHNWIKNQIPKESIPPINVTAGDMESKRPASVRHAVYQKMINDPDTIAPIRKMIQNAYMVNSWNQKIVNSITKFWTKCQEKANLMLNIDDSESTNVTGTKAAVNFKRLYNMMADVIRTIDNAILSTEDSYYTPFLTKLLNDMKKILSDIEPEATETKWGIYRYSVSELKLIMNHYSLECERALNEYLAPVSLYDAQKLASWEEKMEKIAEMNKDQFGENDYQAFKEEKPEIFEQHWENLKEKFEKWTRHNSKEWLKKGYERLTPEKRKLMKEHIREYKKQWKKEQQEKIPK